MIDTRTDADILAALGLPRSLSLRSLRSGVAEHDAPKSGDVTPFQRSRALAALELARRVAALSPAPTLDSPEAVAEWIRPQLETLTDETFRVLALDSRHRLLASVQIANGGRHSVAVTPADCFRAVLPYGPRSVIFTHNHPSGDPYPSEEDKSLTYRLTRAGDVLGIAVQDHIVIGARGAFSSFRHLGLI